MPDGFILTSHFRTTPDYVQVTGTFDPTRMSINSTQGVADCGGEYDNHGPDGTGNPVGAAVDGASDFFQFV